MKFVGIVFHFVVGMTLHRSSARQMVLHVYIFTLKVGFSDRAGQLNLPPSALPLTVGCRTVCGEIFERQAYPVKVLALRCEALFYSRSGVCCAAVVITGCSVHCTQTVVHDISRAVARAATRKMSSV